MSPKTVTLPCGVPRTLHTDCCASGEVFQQNQGFSYQGLGKHTPEQTWDGHNQELALPILHPGVSSQHVLECSTRNTEFPRCFPSSLESLSVGSFCCLGAASQMQAQELAKLGKQMLGKISLY